MSLIEHLLRDDGDAFLRDVFTSALYVLEHDRFCSCGSALDDLRGWLTAGGMARVRQNLDSQMESCRFPEPRRIALRAVLQHLMQSNRPALARLTRDGVFRCLRRDDALTSPMATMSFIELVDHLAEGETSFEEMLRTQGCDEASIRSVYETIDRWLMTSCAIPGAPFRWH